MTQRMGARRGRLPVRVHKQMQKNKKQVLCRSRLFSSAIYLFIGADTQASPATLFLGILAHPDTGCKPQG